MDSPKIALGKYVAIWKLTVKSDANLAGKCHIYSLIYNQLMLIGMQMWHYRFCSRFNYSVFKWSLRHFCH